MTRALAVGLGLVVCGIGCAPRRDLSPGARSLRGQLARRTITVPVWGEDVAAELASNAHDYAGKTLAVERAYLDPRGTLRIGKDLSQFPLAGGGTALVPTPGVPPWLRAWTAAPLKLRGVLQPPRQGDENRPAPDLVVRAESIDFAHPLELACVQVERGKEATWLVAHVENYRGEGARATVELRFADATARQRLPAIAPGGAATVRLKLFDSAPPEWLRLPPERRSLRLVFDDGSATSVDVGKWLEGPADSLLDWGYSFTPPASAVMALSADKPEAELERFAALELRSYLAQFTDANIEPREPEAQEALPTLPLLVVGTARYNALAAQLIRQAGLEARLRELGPEGYLLKSLQHGGQPALLVTAATPRGLVYGVYALLEHYGVRFSMFGARLPARTAFRILDVDEARGPLFARRSLVAEGAEPTAPARWSQWQWLAMIDLAAKNRFNEVVFPLDGFEGTFAYEPGRSRAAVFPFEVSPPHSCLAEALLAHQRGLAVLADYARRRGIDVAFARRSPGGALLRVAAPACLTGWTPPEGIGQPVAVLDDPGDFLGLARVEETARAAGALLEGKAPAIAAPYRSGAMARVSFLARFAWDAAWTPEAHFRRWAATLCEGEAADKLAKAVLEGDRLDEDILAAVPKPFGLGAPLVLPVEERDLACDWGALRARATGAAVGAQLQELKTQGRKLRELQARLEPLYAAFREALGAVAPPWEGPLFETAPAAQRGDRIAEAMNRFRALLGALASVQEATLAYYAGLAEPAEALPQLVVAAGKYRKARRILQWVLSRVPHSEMAPTLAALADGLREQAGRLGEWLGPAAEAEPGARLTLAGSDAIVHLLRTRGEDIFAAYKLAGEEVVHLRLGTTEARVFRRGQPPKTLRAEGGVFLLAVSTVPTYVVVKRAAWPGQPAP